MDSGVATEPWRTSAGPSRSSSLSLDQLCNWRNSYEASARFLAMNEYGSPFATPLSSVQHLDDIVDELNEEVVALAPQGPSQRSQAFARTSTCRNDDLSHTHVLCVSANAGNAAGIAAPCGRPCAPLVCSAHADRDLQADDNGSPVRAIDSTALQAFLCDGNSKIPPAPRQPQPQLPLQPHPQSQTHQRHPGRCDASAPPPPAPHQQPPPQAVPCQPAAISACDVPGAIGGVSPGLHVRVPARTLPAGAGVAALAAPCTPLCTDGKCAATDSPTVGGGRGNFGQPLPGGMLSSLRKAASDVVSQLRALGSGRASRTGSRNDTGAATPTTLSSLRQSIDNPTPHAVPGGGIAAGPGVGTLAGGAAAAAGEATDGGPVRDGLVAAVGLQQGAARTAAARRPQPASSATAVPSLLRKDTSSGLCSSSLGESLAEPSSWVVGARSSLTVWPNGPRDSAGSCSVHNGSRGQPCFLDERQGSADQLPDMWDLARVLDEVDDGFPVSVQGTAAAAGRGLGGAGAMTGPGAFCAAPRVYGGAVTAASEAAKARTAPVQLLPSSNSEDGVRHGLVSPPPSQPKRPMVRPAPTPLAGSLGGLGWPPVSPAAGGSVGAVPATSLRGHDAEQLYVLSELVQQARASEGAELGRSRGGARAAGARGELQQQRLDPQGRRREGATESVLGREPASHHHTTAPRDPPNTGLEPGSAPSPGATRSRASAAMAAAPPMEADDAGLTLAGRSSRGRAVSELVAQLPFSGDAAAGRLKVSDPLYTSAPPRLAFPSTAPDSSDAGEARLEGLWTSFYSVAPTSAAQDSSASVAQWAAAAPAGAVGVASGTGRHALPGLGMYGMSSGALGSTTSLMALETGPELSMFWPLVMPTPVPAVLAGNAEEAKHAAGPFLLNVLVSCSCGCGSALGCSAAAAANSSNNSANGNSSAGGIFRAAADSNPRLPRITKSGTNTDGSTAVQPSPGVPSLPRISINAMLSGVQLAKVELPRDGGQAAMLRLPLLPAMQLVNVFASSDADIGPASTLLAVPPAMADELQGMFADKVEVSVASLMEHVYGDAPSGYESRRRGGGGAAGASGAAAGVAGPRTAALQAQVRRDLAALRAPSPAAPPWGMSVPVWAACRREWRSAMQPLLHDICYLLLCVPNCFAHGLVEWDRSMYCETLARLLAQLERYKLWQTISALLEFCSRQGVALLYQGEALGAGSLTADRLRVLLEGALHDEITIKAIGGGGGDQGGFPRPLLGPDGDAWYAARASALGSGGSGGSMGARGRRASVAALMAPDAADAATAATLQAWRRRSLDTPTEVRDAAAARRNQYDTSTAATADAGGGARRTRAGGAAAALGHAGLGVYAGEGVGAAGAGAGAALVGAGLRTPPDSGRLRSQASIGRVLAGVLSVMAGGRDDADSTGAGHAAAAADTDPGLPAGWDASAGSEAAGAGAAGAAGGWPGGVAATAAAVAAPAGQRLGHVIENTAVVLAFAGVMLQSLL